MDFKRCSGILLHPTSLPGKYGVGSLGREAYEFVDFLADAGQSLWQLCPLGPTGFLDSPYQCFSAFAGNPILISLEKLKDAGLLDAGELRGHVQFPEDRVDFGRVIDFKYPLLQKAYQRCDQKAFSYIADFEKFCDRNNYWLEDYSLFMAIKSAYNGKPWWEWDGPVRKRDKRTLQFYRKELVDTINYQKFIQYIFFQQWLDLKAYANRRKVSIIGDIPVYVAHDSADVWGSPKNFQLDRDLQPLYVAGVPPDYFSETGQFWGNPVFNWKFLKRTRFKWWVDRLKDTLVLYDIVRIDHFRGLEAYWAIPYGEDTAINGSWLPAPGKKLFATIYRKLGALPVIAEDLGFITPEVTALREYFGFPGMKVLQFAFDSEEGSGTEFLPHCYTYDSVVYTGTHDNDTTLGWYRHAGKKDRLFAKEYLLIDEHDISWSFMRGAWASPAMFAIAPLQDVLGLGSEARMNTPGTTKNNWQWRYRKEMLTDAIALKLKKMTNLYLRD